MGYRCPCCCQTVNTRDERVLDAFAEHARRMSAPPQEQIETMADAAVSMSYGQRHMRIRALALRAGISHVRAVQEYDRAVERAQRTT